MKTSECIKYIRFELGLNQAELARKIDKDKTSICLYEKGKRKPGYPTLRKIIDLANANGMNIQYKDLRDE
jgi:transcriptional regulator with XRE-family HTH domain